jgi:hypothetical protein
VKCRLALTEIGAIMALQYKVALPAQSIVEGTVRMTKPCFSEIVSVTSNPLSKAEGPRRISARLFIVGDYTHDRSSLSESMN